MPSLFLRSEYANPAFIYVSDDMIWGRLNILNPHKDVFFVGDGNPYSNDSIGNDLALLAACNHTIISRYDILIYDL